MPVFTKSAWRAKRHEIAEGSGVAEALTDWQKACPTDVTKLKTEKQAKLALKAAAKLLDALSVARDKCRGTDPAIKQTKKLCDEYEKDVKVYVRKVETQIANGAGGGDDPNALKSAFQVMESAEAESEKLQGFVKGAKVEMKKLLGTVKSFADTVAKTATSLEDNDRIKLGQRLDALETSADQWLHDAENMNTEHNKTIKDYRQRGGGGVALDNGLKKGGAGYKACADRFGAHLKMMNAIETDVRVIKATHGLISAKIAEARADLDTSLDEAGKALKVANALAAAWTPIWGTYWKLTGGKTNPGRKLLTFDSNKDLAPMADQMKIAQGQLEVMLKLQKRIGPLVDGALAKLGDTVNSKPISDIVDPVVQQRNQMDREIPVFVQDCRTGIKHIIPLIKAKRKAEK